MGSFLRRPASSALPELDPFPSSSVMTSPQDKKDRKPRNDRGQPKKGGKKNPLANDPVQKELDAIRARTSKISELFAENLAKIRELENNEYFRNIKAARDNLKENVYPRLDAIKAEEAKIRSVIEAEKSTSKQLNTEMRAALPVRMNKTDSYADFFKKNYDAVDKDIQKLQQDLLNVKSLNEERQVVAAVDKAKAQRKKIAEYQHQMNSMQGTNTNFGDRLGELKRERGEIVKEIEKQKEIIAANQAPHDENKKKIAALRKQLDGFKAEREELNKKFDEKRVVLDEKFKVWNVEQDALRKQRDIEYKERKAKEAAERAEEEAERKKEEAMKPPKMAELETCNNLITYMKNLKKTPAAKLNHSLDSFSQFGTFGMTPPKTGKEVADCIATLNTKKAEIEAYQQEVLAKRAAEAAAKEAEEAQKPKESTSDAAPVAEAAAPAAEDAASEAGAPAAEEAAPAEEEKPAEAAAESVEGEAEN